MSLLGSIGLAAAQRLEKTFGPGVALRSYKALLGQSERSVTLAAALGALRCALALGDELELGALAAYWETLREVDGYAPIAAECKRLSREGRAADALVLAAAEAHRAPVARAHYLHARLLEAAGADPDEAYRAALAGGGAVAGAAAAALIERKSARGAPDSEIAALAASVDPAGALPRHRLVIAAARLRSQSRFARAAALSTLAELGQDPALGRAAVQAAARHADDVGPALSWVESERVAAALGAWPDAAERATAVARLRHSAPGRSSARETAREAALDPRHARHLERVQATLGGFELPGEEGGHPEIDLADAALPAIAALVRGEPAAAFEPLRRASLELARRGKEQQRLEVPRALWTLALLAQERGDLRVQRGGLELTRALLTAVRDHPPRGFVPYASAAQRLGAGDVEMLALRRAVVAAEPEAEARLGAALTRRAWAASARGDRAEALGLLSEARALGDVR